MGASKAVYSENYNFEYYQNKINNLKDYDESFFIFDALCENIGMSPKTLPLFKKLKNLADKSEGKKDSWRYASFLSRFAGILAQANFKEEALSIFYEATVVAELIHDDIRRSEALSLIGVDMSRVGFLEESRKQFQKARVSAEKIKDPKQRQEELSTITEDTVWAQKEFVKKSKDSLGCKGKGPLP